MELQNERWIESAWTDFLDFLSQDKFDQCRAIIDATGENGFENDALKMHQKLNEAIAKEDTPYDPDNYRPEYPKE